MDVRPFYFYYKLDIIYVPRQYLFDLYLDWPAAYYNTVQDFDLRIIREHLRSLQMD